MSRGPAAWQRTAAWHRLLVLTVLCVGAAVAGGRADLVFLAAPLVLLAALIGIGPRRGTSTPSAVAGVSTEMIAGNTVLVRTDVVGLADSQFAAVVVPTEQGIPTGAAEVVPGGPDRVVRTAVRTKAWGPTLLARPDVLATRADGLYRYGPVEGGPVRELVLPGVELLPLLALPPILGGWAGAHTSRRPGQGSDLVDLRQFAPGDRMRSIHWRAYARHGTLYTRRTLSDADAEIMLCLDVRTSVGPVPPPPALRPLARARAALLRALVALSDHFVAWRGGPSVEEAQAEREQAMRSSLDLTVVAATAIASAHLSAGDRVGVMTTGRVRRLLRPGTGTRHLQRIRYQLARLVSGPESTPLPVELWGLAGSAVVLLFSPLTDDAAATLAVDCRARGHQVIVIDVLPLRGLLAEVRSSPARSARAEQLRMLALERALRIERIQAAAIPVISWEDGTIAVDLAAGLRTMRGRA